MNGRILDMLMQALTLDEARERLALTADEMDKVIADGQIMVEHTVDGIHVTEQAIAGFKIAERERKLRAMEEITRVSNGLYFSEGT